MYNFRWNGFFKYFYAANVINSLNNNLMNKNTLCATLMLAALLMAFQTTFGQSQRLVLAEECTSSTCGPCAAQNPAFDALLQANPTKITAIKYHMNWPSPGNDPMYQQNTVDNNARKSYYSVSYVPYVRVDGNYLSGAPSQVTQTTINNAYAVVSPFEISINQSLSAGQDTIFVTMLIKATQAVSGTLVAHMAVIEKHIHFNTAPGTNGEKDFYNVMKKMLPTASGTILPTSFTSGDYVILEGYWPLANVYSVSELSVVGFVQNNADKDVLQAANTSENPITAVYAKDVQAYALGNVENKTCTESMSPELTIRNNGSEPLTSLTIHYRVNEEEMQVYNWTGNLPFLSKTTIALPAVSFSLLDNNTLEVFGAQTNGANDDYAANDTLRFAFTPAVVSQNLVYLTLKTDNLPEESTWDIKDANGQVIASGGPYTGANTIYKDTLEIPVSDCYRFTIYDAGGNGICCDNGHGVYALKTNAQVQIIGGGMFTDMETVAFEGDNTTGTGELPIEKMKLNVYPNPFENSANISFTVPQGKDATVKIINAMGKEVYHYPLTNGNAERQFSFDGSMLSAGIYFVKLECDGKVLLSKVVLQK